tara:strand:- start:2150 stop:3214 length:1065 start_codon:yes stop_codon:yes gene_type:complete
MSRLALDVNEMHWRGFSRSRGINESTQTWMPWYVQPHSDGEVLLGDMSAALISNGNVLAFPRDRSTIQLVPGAASSQTSVLLHSNSASEVAVLLKRAHELSKAGRQVTLVSRDDVKMPSEPARRAWRAIQQASRRVGKLPIWYVQNVALPVEPGVRPFPIGVAQPNELAAFLGRTGGLEGRVTQRETLLVCGFMQTRLASRKRAIAAVERNGFVCTASTNVDVGRLAGVALSAPRRRAWQYYEALLRAKFVLSPEGHGRDCFRTWEALALGAIPVLRMVPNASAADAAKFEGLPIVWVRRWKDVTQSFLEERWRFFRSSLHRFSLSRAFWPHWLAELMGDRVTPNSPRAPSLVL